jgi:hypothetical protein
MTERKLKGGVLLGYLNYIKYEWGQKALEQCLSDTGVKPENIKPDTMYSLTNDEKVMKWIGSRGLEYVRKSGNFTVKNLGSLAHLVRFVNIKHLLKRAKDNYADTFNFGEVSILSDEFGKRAVVIMKDCNFIEESGIAWEGAFEGMLEITRTKGTVKRNRNQVKGDPYDEYILDWE